MPLLFRTTLTCQFVYLKKKCDLTESRYGQNISSRSPSRKLGQVDDQGMRDGVHTIRDSCYHREKGAEQTHKGKWQQTQVR